MRSIFAVLLLATLAYADPQCSVVPMSSVPTTAEVAALVTVARGKHYLTTPDQVKVAYCVDNADSTNNYYVIGMPYFRPVTTRPPAVIVITPAAPPPTLTIKKGVKKAYIYTTSVSFRITLDANGQAYKYFMRDSQGHTIRIPAPAAKRRLLPQPLTVTGDIGCANLFADQSHCAVNEWNKLSDIDKAKVALKFGATVTLPLDCALGMLASGGPEGCPLVVTIIKWWISQLPNLCPQYNDESCVSQYCHRPGFCTRADHGFATCWTADMGSTPINQEIKGETSTADCKCECGDCFTNCTGLAICGIQNSGPEPVDFTAFYCAGDQNATFTLQYIHLSCPDGWYCQDGSLSGSSASPPNGNPLYWPGVGSCGGASQSFSYEAILYSSKSPTPSAPFPYIFGCNTGGLASSALPSTGLRIADPGAFK